MVLVPSAITDGMIAGCIRFRSKQRLPALTWHDSKAGGCIYRCAQPMAGITGKHSEDDEALVAALKNPLSDDLTIFDCRSKMAANANSLKGAGLEDICESGFKRASAAVVLVHCNALPHRRRPFTVLS